MNIDQINRTGLPLKGSIKATYALSIILAALMAAASIAGLLCQTSIYPTDDLLQSLLPTDPSVLFIGLPMLLGSMWLTARGRLIGLLLWPGALFYAFYTYLTYVFAMPLSAAFLLHLALVTVSGYTLMALLASIDTKAVQKALTGAVPDRLAGGILAGLGILFFLRALGLLVQALASNTPMGEVDFALNTIDFLIAPSWVICGVLCWRRKAFGNVIGLGMLFQGCMLFIGLIIIMLLQPFIANSPIAWIDVAVVSVMGLICFIPFGLYIRGVVTGRRA
jgi:hypothetical protein